MYSLYIQFSSAILNCFHLPSFLANSNFVNRLLSIRRPGLFIILFFFCIIITTRAVRSIHCTQFYIGLHHMMGNI
jgi:hypothetical protein